MLELLVCSWMVTCSYPFKNRFMPGIDQHSTFLKVITANPPELLIRHYYFASNSTLMTCILKHTVVQMVYIKTKYNNFCITYIRT